jgi:hypothetical protein
MFENEQCQGREDGPNGNHYGAANVGNQKPLATVTQPGVTRYWRLAPTSLRAVVIPRPTSSSKDYQDGFGGCRPL